jgi:thermostable 8-oxoguanine DNA glycosylase
MTDKNSYKNHPERCMCMACAIVSIATEAAEVIDRLENELGEGNIEELRQQVEELRKERDEARRIVCYLMEGGESDTKEQIADKCGWDCYKEEPR